MSIGGHSEDPAVHYDRVTAAWDLILGDHLHHGLFRSSDTDLDSATTLLTELMASAAGAYRGARVLDLGCGTGAQARWLAERYADMTVLGVSTSQVGVGLAQDRAAAAGLSGRVRFLCADALGTGLPSSGFDIVWLIESALYLSPRERMMSECARLLRPGGRLVMCDVMLTRPLELRDLRRLHNVLQTLRATFGDATMSTRAQYAEAAVDAGLSVVEEVDLTTEVLPTYERWRERARADRDRVVALINETGLDAFLKGCDAMQSLFRRDIVCYGLIAADKPS